MDKWRVVEDKVTEKKKSPKWVVVLCVVIGIIGACGLFVGGMMMVEPIVNEYISDKPISQLYNFYDLKVGEAEIAIYFMGNSQIGADVYVPLIEDELRQHGYTNISLYNIYRDSDKPIRRLSQIENIISSKPSMIVYGLSPWIFTNDDGWVDEDVILVHNRLHLNSTAEKYYSSEEIMDSTQGGDAYFLKRFLKNALIEKITGSAKSVNPIVYTKEKTWDAWTSEEKRIAYSNAFGKNGQELGEYVEITKFYANTSRNKISLIPFTAEETRNLLAFEFILQRFAEEDIPVVLVIMPEHSILNELTPDISEANLYEYLDNTGLHWYNLDEMYGDEIMADLTHVHWDGAVQLAPTWADIIIQEVESGAIHYA